jgi:hypothetical protein
MWEKVVFNIMLGVLRRYCRSFQGAGQRLALEPKRDFEAIRDALRVQRERSFADVT